MTPVPQEHALHHDTPRFWIRVLAMFAVIPVVGVTGAKVASGETRLIVYGSVLTICYAGIAAEYAWRAFRQSGTGLATPIFRLLVLVILGMFLSRVLLRIPTTGIGFSDFALYSTTSTVVFSSIGLAAFAAAIAGVVKGR